MSRSIEANALRRLFRDEQSISILNQLSYNHLQSLFRLTNKLSPRNVPSLFHVLRELVQNHHLYKMTERQYYYVVDAYNIAKTVIRNSFHSGLERDVTNYQDIPWSIEEGNQFARTFQSTRR